MQKQKHFTRADKPLSKIEFKGENTIYCEKHTVLSAVAQCLTLK